MDLPPPNHLIHKPETAYCVVSAAHRFNLPVESLLSIMLVENGRIGTESLNANKSVDLGPMQVNSLWLKEKSPLKNHVTYYTLRDDLCVNIHTAAWILASLLPKANNIWTAIGYYHSPGVSAFAWKYKNKVNSKLSIVKSIINSNAYYQQQIYNFYGTYVKK